MNSRIDKYYKDDENTTLTRTRRNEDLYKDINKTEINNLEVKSNATVIGNSNKGNIDVEKIKSILDTHYNDAPKRRSIKLEEPEPSPKVRKLVETKEYDINVILNKAKGEKTEDYSEDRNKKIRDTQYDILNNLKINPKDYIEDYEEEDKPKEAVHHSAAAEDLQRLIDTIALNEEDIKKEKIKIEESVTIKPSEETDDLEEEIEKINDKFASSDEEDSTPLDIFEDLKGDENTTVLEGLQEKTQNMIDDMHEAISSSPKAKEKDIDDSFYTTSTAFKQKDFEEYEEFEDVEKGSSPIVKIIIAILIIVFIIGVGILVKSFL